MRKLGRSMHPFLAASLVSFVGDGIRYAALPLLATRSGAGRTALGLLRGFATLPFLVLGIFGGVLADRTRRRSLLVASDVIRFGLTGLFVLLIAPGMSRCRCWPTRGGSSQVSDSPRGWWPPPCGGSGSPRRPARPRRRPAPGDLVGGNPIGSVLGGLLAASYGIRLPFVLIGIAPLLFLPVYFWRTDAARRGAARLPHPDADSGADVSSAPG